MLKAWYAVVHFLLHIFRQRAGHTANVHLICVHSLWLNKHLMSFFICKTNYFILNRRAITWTSSLDHTRIQRGTIQIGTDNIMGSLIGISQPAGFLLDLHILRICGKRKWHYSLIPKLLFHLAVVDGISCNSGRCSSLETEHFNSQFFQRISQIIGCLQSIWTCIIAYITVNTACFQISSSTQNYRLTMVDSAGIRLHTCDLAILYQKLGNLSLADGQVLLILQRLSHFITVSLLISLSTKGMHCRTLGTVQHLRLNKSLVNIFSHLSTKSIQLTDQMSL